MAPVSRKVVLLSLLVLVLAAPSLVDARLIHRRSLGVSPLARFRARLSSFFHRFFIPKNQVYVLQKDALAPTGSQPISNGGSPSGSGSGSGSGSTGSGSGMNGGGSGQNGGNGSNGGTGNTGGSGSPGNGGSSSGSAGSPGMAPSPSQSVCGVTCLYFFEGAANSIPTINLSSSAPDSPISMMKIAFSAGGSETLVHAANSNMSELVCPSSGEDIKDQFYASQNMMAARSFQPSHSKSFFSGKYVKVTITNAEIDMFGMTTNVNPGDGMSYLQPESQRCILFQIA